MDLLCNYLRTVVIRVQLVAEVLIPQSGTDVGQGDLLAVAELSQPGVMIVPRLMEFPSHPGREHRLVGIRNIEQERAESQDPSSPEVVVHPILPPGHARW